MSLDWLPKDDSLKDHDLWGEEHFSKDAPGVIYEKRHIMPRTLPDAALKAG